MGNNNKKQSKQSRPQSSNDQIKSQGQKGRVNPVKDTSGADKESSKKQQQKKTHPCCD